MGRTLFVTVGTTLFDKLVLSTSSPEALQWMLANGFTRVIIQYGKGVEPSIPKDQAAGFEKIETYRFKPTLEDDMKAADMIISHAGAGTVMEAMRMEKHLVVVINTLLMDNHQAELANAMGSRKHIFVVKEPDDMQRFEIWDEFNTFTPIPYESGDNQDFPRIVDNLVGFGSKKDK
ncbi:Putative bifunctional UDP-N-acetylglucosamine transferase and deubiquitinase ALG13 [Seminavis robusta]|uniref:UDP-N-acetylglucosamine transferase subunit ALG13 n=1 Tax=Seminavis robusta TaxID=568900 RepID=A0A9N8H158_9STRA|nr:Putative bifunctional UDP-N-acetylglucosamine transferase and deubiquitinase ALG13 [Seminavis robusta]|eukprot:Sro11_g008760.1 Putative bifunctional UDP-N-acetylglucosamine transferase and deubiquitinase ALG13 (176) ;mRNA; f:145264-145791